MKAKKLIKFSSLGFLFGLLFPIVAIYVDCYIHSDGDFSWTSITYRIQHNPIHYIILLAPFILGALFFYIGTIFIKLSTFNKTLSKTNRDLSSSNEALDSFNYHISHDLKTVLNNSTALAKMIKKYNDKGDSKKVDEITEKLKTVTFQGSETVQSFLSLGRVNTLIRTDIKEKLNIETEINKVLLHHNLKEEIKITYSLKEYDTLLIQSKFLESIFLNLITNTIKYNKNKPSADIQFIKTDTQRIITFKDNGIGIHSSKLEDVFKPFTRIKNDLNKEGTGVGLYLVKRLVQSFNGDIHVESELDKGTKFTISLPNKKV